MGHPVNFFMLPSDLSIAERAIQSAGDVVFLEDRSKTAEPKELHTITFEPGDMGKRSLRAYIVRDSIH
jgi:hypothetical protein